MLQGKSREEFEKWLKNQPFVYFNKYTKSIIIHNRDWFQLNERFLNALIIEWFDSVGIYINIKSYQYLYDWSYEIKQLNRKTIVMEDNPKIAVKSRTEATTKAIEKAVENFNQLNNGK
jgi:hypothetical protein